MLPPTLLNLLIASGNHTLFQQRTVSGLLWGHNKTVGLFSDYNDSTDGRFNIFTGGDDINKVAIIDKWNGNENLNFWDDKYCNQINGTDGSSFPPFVDKDKPLFFFSADICRSVSAGYQQSMDLKGIPVYHFTLQQDTLAAPVDNPNNQCYCKEKKVSKNCTLAGALDVSSCKRKGIYISLPHFLYGSESLRENVQGLNPNVDEHMTYLDVEPTTGFTLSFAKKIQMNIVYGPEKKIPLLQNIKDYTIFPVVWMNETASVDDETAQRFKTELLSRIDMLEIIQYTLLGVGLGIFVLCLIGVCLVRKTNPAK